MYENQMTLAYVYHFGTVHDSKYWKHIKEKSTQLLNGSHWGTGDRFERKIEVDKKNFLSLLNKTKISISGDDTRHYLNGVYLLATESNKQTFLTGVATDSHRLSSSSLEIENSDFNSLILLTTYSGVPKSKFLLCKKS